MKLRVVLVLAAFGLAPVALSAGQNSTTSGQTANRPPTDPIAEAYAQYLLAHRYQDDEENDQAIAAYRRALQLDPRGAEIASDLANLYMELNRGTEAIAAGEQALKIDPQNQEAHRILGMVYASRTPLTANNNRTTDAQRENLTKAIQHLEQSIRGPMAQADANTRALLSRLYIAHADHDKAIAVLADLVKQEPGWQDGVGLLMEAYTASGRSADAVAWLKDAAPDNPTLYATLAEFYSREGQWSDAAAAYQEAMSAAPRSFDLRMRYAAALLNQDKPAEVAKARSVLAEALQLRPDDERALLMLSQAERQAGEFGAAEQTARRVIAKNRSNARGYAALAESLESRQRYDAVVDALAPVLPQFRSGANSAASLSLLLPHLGFAYVQLGQADKAVATFDEAHRLSPNDPVIGGYLVQAQISAKKYAPAAELAHSIRQQHPDDVRLARLEAEALSHSGKTDAGSTLLEELAARRSDDPQVYIALAQYYTDVNRGSQAIKALQTGQSKLPNETVLTFELGAVYDKQKRHADAEAAFRQVIARDPQHAAALNYLGYMLAERGERLDESIDLVRRALVIDPDNGSYLDSLGWAYYKSNKLELALDNLKKAADQLARNSVIQDHYGDVLFKLGRFEDAIAAWDRALTGDGDSIDRGDVDKKIRSARQKLPKK